MVKVDIKELAAAFEKAVQLGDEERAQFIASFESDKPELAQKLAQLLASDAEEKDLLRSWVATETSALADKADDPWIDRIVGSWKIVKRIGSGGMGAVFLAHRSDAQFEQTVAVKVMGAQLLSESAAERFRFERQTLAKLNHPNIATLIDGGSTELNLPFLIMEYVEGVPIDQYCAANNLGLKERLGLFQKVCAAIDYAHKNLIVHRDLKPDNILVTEAGEPKLLDFGVAKLIEPQSADADAGDGGSDFPQTRAGSRIMTLDYASPEQVRGEPVSIATDVYALGVLLYKLLTGQSPYGDTLTTDREIENAILAVEPKLPSSAITSGTASSSGTPSQHDEDDTENATSAPAPTSSVRYRKRLAGDLDNIVLKCLQKNPERRYASANDLSDELRRYLNHEPVEARGRNWTYIAGKFLSRHALAAASAAAAFLLIVGLVSFYTFELAAERDRAQLAASEAEQVSGFLTNMLRSAAPAVSQGETITAVDLLNSGVEQIELLADQPILQSNLYRIMGYSYTEVGEYTRGLSLHEKSIAVLEGVADVEPLLLAENYSALAEAQRVLEFYDDSIESRLRALAIFEKELGPEHQETIHVKVRLGTSLETAGRAEEALKHLREAREVSERVTDGYTHVTLDSMGVGAVVLSNLGQYREAELLNAEAIKHSNIVLGELSPNTIIRIRNSGVYTREQFKFHEALAFQREANERGALVWPAQSPLMTYGLQQVAITTQFLGWFDEAQRFLEKAQVNVAAGPGENSLDFAFQLATVGGWHFDKAEYEEALAEFRRSYDIAVGLNGKDTRRAVEASIGIGQSLLAMGDVDEAIAVLRDAMSRSGSVRVHTKLIGARTLATALSQSGAFAEADEMFKSMISEKESHVGPDNAALVPYLMEASAHERRKENIDAAFDHAGRAHRLALDGMPEGNWIAALAAAEYARVLMARGDHDQAAELVRGARADLVETFGAAHFYVAEID